MSEWRPSIPYAVRDQHIYMPGKTRHGKTTLMHRMVYQDIKNNAGVTVIDPKGDFAKSLLDWIPPHRIDDTIYLSLENPVPVDFLDHKNEDEREALVGELKYLITRGATTEHAPLMTAILTDIIYTILLYNDNQPNPSKRATFLDIHRFLAEEARRETILEGVKHTRFYRRWKDDFPNPKDRQPTLIRMNPFINSSSLSKILGCPNPRLNISRVMDKRKVLIVDLGGMAESNQMLGSLLIAKIQQTTFRRHSLLERERTPHFLYIDEFDLCQTAQFNNLLSRAGGYGLRLCLANQFVGQLDDVVRKSVFGNISSYIVFCVGDDETRHFRAVAQPYDCAEIARFPKYKALFKIAGEPEAVIKNTLPLPANPYYTSPAADIRKRTIEQYFVPPSHMPSIANTVGNDAKPDDITSQQRKDPARQPNQAKNARTPR